MRFSNLTETRPYPQRARERITGSKVLTRLIDHVEGKIELSNSQVNAAKALLAKVLPDVRTTQVTSSLQIVRTHRLGDEQFMGIAVGRLRPEAIEGECETVREPLKLMGGFWELRRLLKAPNKPVGGMNHQVAGWCERGNR